MKTSLEIEVQQANKKWLLVPKQQSLVLDGTLSAMQPLQWCATVTDSYRHGTPFLLQQTSGWLLVWKTSGFSDSCLVTLENIWLGRCHKCRRSWTRFVDWPLQSRPLAYRYHPTHPMQSFSPCRLEATSSKSAAKMMDFGTRRSPQILELNCNEIRLTVQLSGEGRTRMIFPSRCRIHGSQQHERLVAWTVMVELWSNPTFPAMTQPRDTKAISLVNRIKLAGLWRQKLGDFGSYH